MATGASADSLRARALPFFLRGAQKTTNYLVC